MAYKNIVFEGGGVKGVAYIGALNVLEEKGILQNIERVAGTSAGAITSCMVSLRYSPEYIGKTIRNMDMGSFADHEGVLKKMHNYGMHPGDAFLKWIRKQIAGSNHDFGEDATFADFNKAGCRDLHVFASDIYTHKVKEFSFEKTPDTIVAEAVRASMSIPLYFNAWQFSNNKPDDHLYVDGGMVYNYPLTIFDKGNTANMETIGFMLEDLNGNKKIEKYGYGNWGEYVKNTFETLLKAQVIDFYRDANDVKRTVVIDDLGIKATDFDLSNEVKNNLIASGRKATESFFEKLNA